MAEDTKTEMVRLVDLIEELCDAVDNEGGDVGGGRGSLTILRDIGPLITPARAMLARLTEAHSAECEEFGKIGERDGYEKAVQDIDELTGGDGEYRFCTNGDPERHCPGPDEMKQRIAGRFEELHASLAQRDADIAKAVEALGAAQIALQNCLPTFPFTERLVSTTFAALRASSATQADGGATQSAKEAGR
jgi:hypothetical protein